MNMKSVLTVAALCAACLTLPAVAAPRVSDSCGMDYLVAAQNLSPWYAGAFFRNHDRHITLDNGIRHRFNTDRAGGFVAFDITRWLTVYGMAACTWNNFDDVSHRQDTSTFYGAGLWFNILDHDLLDGLMLENRFRLDACAQFMMGDTEIVGEDLSYVEFYGSLTASIVNEIVGDKSMWPEAIGVFFGPSVTSWDSSDFDADHEDLGFAVGLDVYLTRRTILSAAFEIYEKGENATGITLGTRF